MGVTVHVPLSHTENTIKVCTHMKLPLICIQYKIKSSLSDVHFVQWQFNDMKPNTKSATFYIQNVLPLISISLYKTEYIVRFPALVNTIILLRSERSLQVTNWILKSSFILCCFSVRLTDSSKDDHLSFQLHKWTYIALIR